MSLTVRPARKADTAAIHAIYADAVAHGTATYELDIPTSDEMAARFAAITEAGQPWLVAEMNGIMVGYAYAGPFRARPAYRFIVEDSIYVAPGQKRSGVGRALLVALIDACAALGYRQLIAVIGDGPGNPGSVGLHAALGFRHCGVMEGSGYKFERWLDTVIMQLALNGGTGTPPDAQSWPERSFRLSQG
ncbi:MAG: N-acetyltransferase [Phyllobacteriaceae bacterium]|nr:N-acetyltransferase [Phyllobacteriaceae bacterium]